MTSTSETRSGLVRQLKAFERQIHELDVLRVVGTYQLWNNLAREKLLAKIDERQASLRIQVSDTIDTINALQEC